MHVAVGKRPKRVILLLAVCFCAFLLTGCGATLSVYDYTEDGLRYNMCELKLDNGTAENMERTATTDADGNKYTVAGYFSRLFADFGYGMVSAAHTDNAYVVRYSKVISDRSELDSLGTEVAFTSKHTETPFVRTYTAVSENPFNGVREKYDNVQPLHSSTVVERIKNGAIAHDENGENIVSLPAIDDAFPYLKGLSPDGLLLNYIRYGSDRMDSSGTKITENGKIAYVFSRYFDNSKAYMQYRYTRAVPYGWYLTAIAAGAIVFGVIMLATRTRRQKPTLLDKFPYNPEEYRDYDHNLPTSIK